MGVNGHMPNAFSLCLAKITGISSAIALNNYQYKQSYFYYRNAGYLMRFVIICAFVIDISMYLLIAFLASQTLKKWQL